MTSANTYMPLRKIGVLMALDAGGAIADTIRFWADVVSSAGKNAADSGLSSDAIYLSWTIVVLRLLVWVLTLAALSRLTGLHKSFQKAKLWYLLRILVYVVEILFPVGIQYRHPDLASDPNMIALVAFSLLLIIGIILIEESFLLPLGNRAVLSAGAALMDSFGMEQQARKNRGCGKWLIVFSLAQIFLVLLIVGPTVWLRQAMERLPLEYSADAYPGLVLLILAAAFLCVPVGTASLVFRLLAAVRMERTYCAMEELTK